MKFLVLLLGVLMSGQATNALSNSYFHLIRHKEPPPPPAISSRAVSEKWITQKLDHFNSSDTRSFQMRYYANDEFYQPGGPIFIFVGGEWTINPGWATNGHTVDMAREKNGYVFYTEHRYYGQTKPTSDLSVENLQYLDVDQALEDLAHFIRVQKSTLPGATSSGVILVGASYTATMVSWFRQRYPDLANGAWASSGPLHAQVDFAEYKEVVGQSIRSLGGAACYDRIERAFTQITSALDTGNYAILDTAFNTCTSLATGTEIDRWNFFNEISELMSGIVQGHYIQSTTIQDACSTIVNASITNDLEAYAGFVRSLMASQCLPHQFNDTINFLSGTDWNSDVAQDSWRQWWWQTCNEFGWFQTLSSPNQPFGSRSPVELHTRICAEAYSEAFTPTAIEANVQRTNLYNFGLAPEFSNVMTTHGVLDPWSSVGLQAAPNAASPVIIIPLASHCNDLNSLSANDSTEMRAVKMQIQQLVTQWLG